MTPERWQQINELFEAALTQNSNDRVAFVRRAADGDSSLADRVTKLLAADDQVVRDGFLKPPESPVMEAADTSATSKLVGARIGPYEIRRFLASGGMGAVYLAERVDAYRQQVAIKLMKCGLDEEGLRRFHTERQVLARLDHPHIARLLDGGTTGDGQPYYVMEFVDGKRISHFCDTGEVPTADRLRLFQAVCLAVQHAHDRGIIHRDLKPANILVTADGTPKLTDFGLAKTVVSGQSSVLSGDGEAATVPGQILGTPSYMAPEQAAGKSVDGGPLADVYSLGAILYELLTSRPPFRGGNWRETLEQVCTQEPISLRRLQPLLPRDLETICLKCLQKEPGKRYSSARALANEIGRFLAGELIHAKAVTNSERLYRWCRRKPMVAGLLGTVVLLVVTGMPSLLYLWLLAERRQAAMQVEKETADRQRKLAESRLQLAQQAVREMTSVAEDRLALEPRMQEVQRDILVKALEFYQQLVQEEPTDPKLRFGNAQAFHFMARIQNRLGKPKEAEALLYRQLSLLRHLETEFPDDSIYGFDEFHSLLLLSETLSVQSRKEEAKRISFDAYALIEKLATQFPDKPYHRDALACQGAIIGSHLRGEGKPKEAEKVHRQALAVAEKLVRDFPINSTPPYYVKNVALNLYALGLDLREQGEWEEAAEMCEKAIRAADKLADEHPEEPRLRCEATSPLELLGDLYVEMGKLTEAEEALHRSITIHEQFMTNYPSVPIYQSGVAQAESAMGCVYLAQGNEERAAIAFQRELELLKQVTERFPGLVHLMTTRAWRLAVCPIARLRDPSEAIRVATQLLDRGPDRDWLYTIIGVAEYRAGNWRAALAALEKGSLEDKAFVSAYVFLFKSMAYWQCGEKARAREAYDVAVRQMDGKKPGMQIARLIRREAEELTGIGAEKIN